MERVIGTLVGINLILTMIYDSGFWESLDEWVNEKMKPYHLPHIFKCLFCQTWWVSLFSVLVMGEIGIWTIVLCLANAELTDFMYGMVGTVKRMLLSVLEAINKHIK